MSDFGSPDPSNVVSFPKATKYLLDRGINHALIERLGLRIVGATELRELGITWPNVEFGVAWQVCDAHGVNTGNIGARVWYRENQFAGAPNPDVVQPKFISPKGQKPRLYYSPLARWDTLKKGKVVYLCESYLKADIMCALGYFAVGITGIWGWSHKRKMIDDLKDLASLDVHVVAFFDSNVHEQLPKNYRAVEDLKAEFDSIGGQLSWLPLPPKVDGEGEDRVDWGIDDFYVARGQEAVDQITERANRKEVLSGLRSKLRIFDRQVVYVEDVGRVVDEESGSLFTASAAITSRWAHVTHYDGERVISVARAWLQNEHRRSVKRIEYQPGMDRVVGDEYYNLWGGWGVEPAAGDTSLFESWLVDAIPDETEREWFANWIAWPIQNPTGRMTQAAILLGKPGVGKGWLAALLSRTYGRDNVAFVDIEVLARRFNADYSTKHLVVVEESDAAWKSDSRSVNNRIKDFITQQWRRVERKGVDAFMVPAVGHLLLEGNDIDVVKLDEDDRRVGVLWVEGEGIANNRSYWDPRWAWLEGEGPAAFMQWALDRDLSGFDPQGVPPLTKAKRQMIEFTRNSMEGWVRDLMNEPSSVLVSPLGVDITDYVFSAKELYWLYEGNADLPFSELNKRKIDQMSRELQRAHMPMAYDGAKVNVKPIKGSPFRMNSTRMYVLPGHETEPPEGWPTVIRRRGINKLLYGG